MKKRTSGAKGILLIAFLLFAVVLGALIFKKYETAARKVEPPPAAQPVGTFVSTLFFATPDGQSLVREGREVEIAEGVEEGVESVVDELIGGPVGAPRSILPKARASASMAARAASSHAFGIGLTGRLCSRPAARSAWSVSAHVSSGLSPFVSAISRMDFSSASNAASSVSATGTGRAVHRTSAQNAATLSARASRAAPPRVIAQFLEDRGRSGCPIHQPDSTQSIASPDR